MQDKKQPTKPVALTPTPPHFDHDLFMRALDKEMVVVIDEVTGQQVVIFDKKQ